MTKNHEQELLIQLKSYLEPAVKVGLYNVQTLLNRNYQCTELEVKSQYPTELALSMRENYRNGEDTVPRLRLIRIQ